MAAALLFFVGREALRTSRTVPRASTPAAPEVEDSTPARLIAEAGEPLQASSRPLHQAPATALLPPTRVDRAELRRRIDAGAPGTYIADMLVDADSLLTRWPERLIDPVRVWVQRAPPVPDWTPELAVVAQTAFDEWGEVGFPVRFTFTVDSARSDVRVLFVNRMSEGNRLGVTTHRRDRAGWIVSAEIVISTHDSSGAAHPPSLISAIARHEVGHALGLAHSRDRTTIMYPESRTLSITGPDRATLKLLYTLPPGSVR